MHDDVSLVRFTLKFERWYLFVQQTGTVQGKYQPDGILGYIGDDYILEPLGSQTVFTFSIPETSQATNDLSAVHGKAFQQVNEKLHDY